ncbi:MAG: WecB/TagA/CpsF family glycosyltransferase [Flavobacteriales bacterium]|nr:WecB/TagA/CpsF family glycosyltransferase [Flavobacteriales bacterium]
MFKRLLDHVLTFILFILVLPFLFLFFLFLIFQKSLFRNWSIWKQSKSESQESKVLGVPFYNNDAQSATERIKKDLFEQELKTYFFINPHAMNISMRDKSFYEILKGNNRNLPDGIGIKMAGIFMGYRLVQNLNGTDLFPLLAEMLEQEGKSLYLLGAKEGVAEQMKANVERQWSALNILGVHNGYFDKVASTDKVIDEINRLNPDVLLVAFGMPTQEKWIHDHRDRINAKIVFALGGLFDFYSNMKPRAPEAWRQIGMEWAYRLLTEPKRLWKRYLIGNPLFIVHVLKWRYLGYNK